MSDIVSHPLKFPLERRSKAGELIETITSITLKRPKGKEMKAVKAHGGMGMLIDLVGICGGLLPADVDALDGADLMVLVGMVGDFLDISPPTGATS